MPKMLKGKKKLDPCQNIYKTSTTK